MKKSLRRWALGAVAVCGATLALNAQETAPETADLYGYYRVQNVATGKYVEVRGPFTTAPDVTLDEARTKAGTVMRLRAMKNPKGTNYKIGNLSSQGIEVFGAPVENYYQTLFDDVVSGIDTSDYMAAAYSLQRYGSQFGYIATGRMLIEALFEVVTGRLDSEISKLTDAELEAIGLTRAQATSGVLTAFARRFNKEVSEKLDLHAYLEPVNEAEGTYRLYFNWIDCAPVSEFYLHSTEQNKKEFELGFACMRKYMESKSGLGSGEYIDTAELALWESWGFDADAFRTRYADRYADSGEKQYYTLSYEEIFADHTILYNWLKMYIYRFLDPAQAPDASILGINFKDFATEMQRHAIMQGFLKYIPSIQENQKLYLTSGRFASATDEFSTVGTTSDNSDHFGLLGESHVAAGGNAAVWKLDPIDATTPNCFAINTTGDRINKIDANQNKLQDTHFAAIYVDFPMNIISPAMQVRNLGAGGTSAALQTAEKKNLGKVDYVELSATTANYVPRRTCALIEVPGTAAEADYIVEIPWEQQESDYNPSFDVVPDPKPEGFEVSNEVVGVQRAPRRAAAATNAYHGVLLSTPVNTNAFRNLLGIDADMTGNSAYDLTTKTYQSEDQEGNPSISTPWYSEASTIPANHAFILAPKTDSTGAARADNGISLEAPEDQHDIATGIDAVIPDAEMKENVIYDLQGRRVSKVFPGGIYILNGKKIIIR